VRALSTFRRVAPDDEKAHGFWRNGEQVQISNGTVAASLAETIHGFGFDGGRCAFCGRRYDFEEYRNTETAFLTDDELTDDGTDNEAVCCPSCGAGEVRVLSRRTKYFLGVGSAEYDELTCRCLCCGHDFRATTLDVG
jgi:hypothetical protein